MKDWLPGQIAFIKAHFQIDMTPGELARFFMVATPDIWQLAKAMNLPGQQLTNLTAVHTPYPPEVAAAVPKFHHPEPLE